MCTTEGYENVHSVIRSWSTNYLQKRENIFSISSSYADIRFRITTKSWNKCFLVTHSSTWVKNKWLYRTCHVLISKRLKPGESRLYESELKHDLFAVDKKSVIFNPLETEITIRKYMVTCSTLPSMKRKHFFRDLLVVLKRISKKLFHGTTCTVICSACSKCSTT